MAEVGRVRIRLPSSIKPGEIVKVRVMVIHPMETVQRKDGKPVALGADGKIYFGGFGLRHYTGGGLGWYDPKTGQMDGLWQPLSGYGVYWLASALDG